MSKDFKSFEEWSDEYVRDNIHKLKAPCQYREIGFMEGYRLMRRTGADWLSCVFMAFVWVLRGDRV